MLLHPQTDRSSEPRQSAPQQGFLDKLTCNTPNEIRLLNWNIAKGVKHGWHNDLRHLSQDKDLVIIQEAALGGALEEVFSEHRHRAFSPGFRNKMHQTGVMTASRVAPLNAHSFRHTEPIIRTPKATLITEYALQDTDKTLMVVNIHAVNFTIGTRIFTAQLDRVYKVLLQHDGPILFCGDFNTWRQQRVKRLQQLIESLSLRAIDFEQDRRKHSLGLPLDHVFYRGLIPNRVESQCVTSSDHNPISVSLDLHSCHK